MITETNDGINFNFPKYHTEDSLSISLSKMYSDPRAVAVLYGCGTYPTTDNFKTVIEKTLETHGYESTITIADLLDFDVAQQLINGDDLSELTGDDYPEYAEIDDYRLELCAYCNSRIKYDVSEELLNRAYLKFICQVAKLKNKHDEKVGLSELMANDNNDKEDPDAEDFFGPNPEPNDEQIDYLYGTNND